VEPIVDRLREGTRYALDPRKVVDACARDGLEATELS
jgi:hypothetical protein